MNRFKQNRFKNSEDGSVLIIALIFVTAMGLVVGGIASLATVDIRNTSATRDQRGVVYTADGSVKAAINTFRETNVCANGAVPQINSTTVSVSCIDQTTTASGGSSSNQPPLAVITLPEPGESGITAVSGSDALIDGGMYSKTDMDVSGGATLTVLGETTARTGPAATPTTNCGGAGTYILDPSAINNCRIGTVAYPKGQDPASADPMGYAPAAATAPSNVVVVPSTASCPALGGTITMPRGTYTSAAALNALFAGCPGRIFHFPPNGSTVGVYYFDFTDSGDHEWVIDSPATVVVGGTLSATPTIAGSACDPAASGVQFIFGGDSRIYVSAARAVDICAQHDPTATKQQLAVYGLKDSFPARASMPVAVTPQNASTVGAQFESPDNGRDPDGSSFAKASVASTTSGPGPTKTMTVSNFALPADLTGAATINGVSLNIRHQDTSISGNLNRLDLEARVTTTASGVAPFTCASGCLSKDAANHVDSRALPAAFRSVIALQNLTVTYSATANNHGSNATSFEEYLDGITLSIDYTPLPAFHRQSGCMRVAPYGAAGSCALLRTSGSNANLSIRGTAYAPVAPLDIHLTSVAYQVFDRGIVVRSLRLNLTSSSGCTAAASCSAFKLPPATTVPGTTSVVFQATVEGRKRLRALVDFPVSGPPVVRSWSALNES